jgi:hypothetical protein
MRKTGSWCSALALALLLNCAAQAETSLSEADIDALAAQPGTEVTKRQEGDTQITEIRRAGVVITIRRKGDKADSVGQDNTATERCYACGDYILASDKD